MWQELEESMLEFVLPSNCIRLVSQHAIFCFLQPGNRSSPPPFIGDQESLLHQIYHKVFSWVIEWLPSKPHALIHQATSPSKRSNGGASEDFSIHVMPHCLFCIFCITHKPHCCRPAIVTLVRAGQRGFQVYQNAELHWQQEAFVIHRIIIDMGNPCSWDAGQATKVKMETH